MPSAQICESCRSAVRLKAIWGVTIMGKVSAVYCIVNFFMQDEYRPKQLLSFGNVVDPLRSSRIRFL